MLGNSDEGKRKLKIFQNLPYTQILGCAAVYDDKIRFWPVQPEPATEYFLKHIKIRPRFTVPDLKFSVFGSIRQSIDKNDQGSGGLFLQEVADVITLEVGQLCNPEIILI